MQANIADGSSHVLGWRQRAADLRLVDIAEADVRSGEVRDRFRIVPAFMANLDDSRILDELAEQLFKILAVERGVLVGNRKLDQQCPQAAFRRQPAGPTRIFPEDSIRRP